MTTEIKPTRFFEKQLDRVPANIQDKVSAWAFSVRLLGLLEVRKRPGLHDEPLHGSRLGQRSVRLNKSYRLIYRELNGVILIELLEVHKHAY